MKKIKVVIVLTFLFRAEKEYSDRNHKNQQKSACAHAQEFSVRNLSYF